MCLSSFFPFQVWVADCSFPLKIKITLWKLYIYSWKSLDVFLFFKVVVETELTTWAGSSFFLFFSLFSFLFISLPHNLSLTRAEIWFFFFLNEIRMCCTEITLICVQTAHVPHKKMLLWHWRKESCSVYLHNACVMYVAHNCFCLFSDACKTKDLHSSDQSLYNTHTHTHAQTVDVRACVWGRE